MKSDENMYVETKMPYDGDKILSKLEMISLCHAYPNIIGGKPQIFSTEWFRKAMGQWPFKVEEEEIIENKGCIDTSILPEILEKRYEPTVILGREKGEVKTSLYLPPAKNKDPYERLFYVPDSKILNIAQQLYYK